MLLGKERGAGQHRFLLGGGAGLIHFRSLGEEPGRRKLTGQSQKTGMWTRDSLTGLRAGMESRRVSVLNS